MGAVYIGRPTEGEPGETFVAVKRAHAHLLEDATFREMFVAEARLASRIRHPHVVGVRDVDESDGELLLVMDYIEGASFAELLSASHKQGRRLPGSVGVRILLDAALGLHAAHSVRDEAGRPLGIVHRDVSPHNVLVGVDGLSRIVDFGVAKAIDHEGTNTQSGVLKGKAAYMAPEYLNGRRASPRSDVFSLGIVAWEGLSSRRLFRGEDELETMHKILDPEPAPRLSEVVDIDAELDAIVAKALEKDRLKRYASAREFADALELAARELDLVATPAEVGALVDSLVGEQLDSTRQLLQQSLESSGERRVSRRRADETATVLAPRGLGSTVVVTEPSAATIDLATKVDRPIAATAIPPTLQSAQSPPTGDKGPGGSAFPTLQMAAVEGAVQPPTVPLGQVASLRSTVQMAPPVMPLLRQPVNAGSSPAIDQALFQPTPAQLYRAPVIRLPTHGSLAAMPVSTARPSTSIAPFIVAAGGLVALGLVAVFVIRSHAAPSPLPASEPSAIHPETAASNGTRAQPTSSVTPAVTTEAATDVPTAAVNSAAALPSSVPSTSGSPSPRSTGGRATGVPDRFDPSSFKPKKNPYGP